jgi:hypothetical protein
MASNEHDEQHQVSANGHLGQELCLGASISAQHTHDNHLVVESSFCLVPTEFIESINNFFFSDLKNSITDIFRTEYQTKIVHLIRPKSWFLFESL